MPFKKLTLGVAALAVGSFLAPAAPEDPPTWWTDAGVAGAASPTSPANIGQLKNMAHHFNDELEGLLPPGWALDLDTLFAPKPDNPTEAWYDEQKAIVNLGQLKFVSSTFYDRLNSLAPDWVDQQMTLNSSTLDGWPDPYPWSVSTPPADNYKPVNQGQLKLVFSLRVNQDLDNDGIPDLQEHILYGSTVGDGSNTDYDGDELSDYEELITYSASHNTSPFVKELDTDNDGLTDLRETLLAASAIPGINWNDPDSDNDGMSDGWEYRYWDGVNESAFDPDHRASKAVLDDDYDGDGLTNAAEAAYGGDPNSSFTTGDPDGPDDQELVDEGQSLNDDDSDSSVDSAQFTIKFGDNSGSGTEDWALIVRETDSAQSDDSGESAQPDQVFNGPQQSLTSAAVSLREGSTYEITMLHLSTTHTSGTPDFDWSAFISTTDSAQQFLPETPVTMPGTDTAQFEISASNGLTWIVVILAVYLEHMRAVDTQETVSYTHLTLPTTPYV